MIKINTKRCSTCKQIKPISEFRKWRNSCKFCEKIYHQLYVKTEKGKKSFRKSLKKYQQTEKGKIAFSKSYKKYSQTEKGKINNRNRVKKFNKFHPEQLKASNATAYAIRTNRLPHQKTLNCFYCPKQAEHYHHPDYSKPLFVIPVCQQCHQKLHRV